MSEERYQYEVMRQREEMEFQKYMEECFELLSQDEAYQEWLKEIQQANLEYQKGHENGHIQ